MTENTYLWIILCFATIFNNVQSNGRNVKVNVNPKDGSVVVHSNGQIFKGNLGELGVHGSIGHSRRVPIGGTGSVRFTAPNGASSTLQISGQKHGPTYLEGSASGTLWQNSANSLQAGGTFSKNVNNGAPASVGGTAVLSGPRGSISTSVQKPGGEGTSIGVQGQGTIWSNPSGSAKLTGNVGWSRNFHGPQGTGPANFGARLNFIYRPQTAPRYPFPFPASGPCSVTTFFLGCRTG